MRPIIKYGGRKVTGPSEWVVYFDLINDPHSTKHYWCKIQLGDYAPGTVDPHFWAYFAYLGSKFIENRQIFDETTGELLDPSEEAAARARKPVRGMEEPRVGQVCWRFGSPPYEGDTSDDAFQAR